VVEEAACKLAYHGYAVVEPDLYCRLGHGTVRTSWQESAPSRACRRPGRRDAARPAIPEVLPNSNGRSASSAHAPVAATAFSPPPAHPGSTPSSTSGAVASS
jgi:hypothetical protein